MLNFPTEIIDLPSKGVFYPEDHPLASGQIELYHMTARHEDILTSTNLLSKGLNVVVDRLLSELIATKGVKLDDLLIGDKNAIFVAARVLGYGKDYPCELECPSCGTGVETVANLEALPFVEFEIPEGSKGQNKFEMLLPTSGKSVTFKLLTQGDETAVEKELKQWAAKVGGDVSHASTTRLRRAIQSVDGDTSVTKIHNFVDAMPIRDSRALREFARKISPDVQFEIDFTCESCQHTGKVEVPVGPDFFWPDARV
jgi:hypothetical protein